MANLVNKPTTQQLEVFNSLASSIAKPALISHTIPPTNSSSQNLSLWHNCYGHLHQAGLIHLSKNKCIRGLPTLNNTNDIYGACMVGQQLRERFSKSSNNCALHVLHLIHSNLIGPMFVSSLERSPYFVVFINDHTRKSCVYFMTVKSETFQMFQNFKSRVENEIGTRIHNLRTDRRGKYLSHEFCQFLTGNGIYHQLTMSRTPQQNRMAERRNCSIIERTCCMANANNYPGFLWPKVVNAANHFINISPTRTNSGIPLNQLYHKAIPKVNHLRIFWSLCYLHVPKEHISKLESKTKPYFFVGYDEQSKAYRVYEPITRKVHISRDIVFNKQKIGFQYCQQPSTQQSSTIDFPKEDSVSPDQLDSPTSQSSDSPTINSTQLIETFQSFQFPPNIPPTSLTHLSNSANQVSHSFTPSPSQEIPPQSIPIQSLPILPRCNPSHECCLIHSNNKFKDHFVFSITNTPKDIDFPVEPRDFQDAMLHPSWKAICPKRNQLYTRNFAPGNSFMTSSLVKPPSMQSGFLNLKQDQPDKLKNLKPKLQQRRMKKHMGQITQRCLLLWFVGP